MKNIFRIFCVIMICLFFTFGIYKVDSYIFSTENYFCKGIVEIMFLIFSSALEIIILCKIAKTKIQPESDSLFFFLIGALFFAGIAPTVQSAMSLIKVTPIPNLETTRIERIFFPSLFQAKKITKLEADFLEPLEKVSVHKFNNVIQNTKDKELFYYLNFNNAHSMLVIQQVCCTTGTDPDITTTTNIYPETFPAELGNYIFLHENGKNIAIDENKGELILKYQYRKATDSKDIQRWIVGFLATVVYFLFCYCIFKLLCKINPTDSKTE